MLAFLLGAVAGAAVALLYAPATGQETREFLGEKAREGRERATEAAARGREVVNRGRETVATAIERGREAYEQARTAGHDRIAERRRVSVWAEVFLGVIAVATLAMAIAQIGVLVAAGRLARRVGRLLDQVELELKPVFGHLNAIGRDASRAAALATAQVERVDRLFTDLTDRVDETVQTLHSTLAGPAKACRLRALGGGRPRDARRPRPALAARAKKKTLFSSSALRPAPAG